ncbi:hypothetical protein BV22DRAFT_1050810 [Leucogyrophana mollusca]|uniref:Uncharacterized protein n=1 Tax=Leucogyrophana mollusca TaxID=85980 RepID=A0ACB8B2A1_9AGAM|nr:hypothetical protein BV22DRAFT_1050810 [Leucogyrophana mollusca]
MLTNIGQLMLSHKFAHATKGLKETKEPYLLLTASLDTGDIEKWTAEEKQATDQRGDALDIYQLTPYTFLNTQKSWNSMATSTVTARVTTRSQQGTPEAPDGDSPESGGIPTIPMVPVEAAGRPHCDPVCPIMQATREADASTTDHSDQPVQMVQGTEDEGNDLYGQVAHKDNTLRMHTPLGMSTAQWGPKDEADSSDEGEEYLINVLERMRRSSAFREFPEGNQFSTPGPNGYQEMELQSYCTLIQERGIKPTAPPAYDGTDGIENHAVGDEYDARRIDFLGMNLTGLAQDWFSQEVESPSREIWHWTYEDVLCALYKRFITEATAQRATDQFLATQYSRSRGAQAFYNDLQRRAVRMVQCPNGEEYGRCPTVRRAPSTSDNDDEAEWIHSTLIVLRPQGAWIL